MDLPYYSAYEAANRLGLEYHTFMARVRSGKYPCHQVGRAYLFEKAKIEQLAEAPKTTGGVNVAD